MYIQLNRQDQRYFMVTMDCCHTFWNHHTKEMRFSASFVFYHTNCSTLFNFLFFVLCRLHFFQEIFFAVWIKYSTVTKRSITYCFSILEINANVLFIPLFLASLRYFVLFLKPTCKRVTSS